MNITLSPSGTNYRSLTLSGVGVAIRHIITNYDGAAAHLELNALRSVLLPDVAPAALLQITAARRVVDAQDAPVPSAANFADIGEY